MLKKKILLSLFLLAVAAGVYYPVSKIIRFEFPSVQPVVCRFRAGLYDPYDPFRGRYVALRAEMQVFETKEVLDFQKRNNVYAVLEIDGDGWARLVDLTETPPPGKTVLRVSYYWYRITEEGEDGENVHRYDVSFPFHRFYMNEKLAPEAEDAIREAVSRAGGKCAIVVKVYEDGNFAITDLEIDDVPIHEFLERRRRAEAEKSGS